MSVVRPLLACIAMMLIGNSCTSVTDEMEMPTTIEKLPVLHMPVKGTWRLLRSPGHAAFAFDLAAVDAPSKATLKRSRIYHLLGRTSAVDSYSWSQPVFAPSKGTVVEVGTGQPDRRKLSLLKDLWSMLASQPEQDEEDIRPFAGNYVIIEGNDFYVFLAHLQEGSLAVRAGEEVEIGQQIGRVGNSGFTLEPHLHFQLFEQIEDLENARAPEFHIDEFEQWTRGGWEPRVNDPLEKGTIVRAGDRGS